MLIILLAATSILTEPTHSLETDQRFFARERPVFEQLVKAVRLCGKLPEIHLPFMAMYGNQVCPNGGAAAAEAITELVSEAHLLDADQKQVVLSANTKPVSAIMLRTGANGLGFQLGASTSLVWYFPDGLPPQDGADLKPLELGRTHWYQQLMTNDVEDH